MKMISIEEKLKLYRVTNLEKYSKYTSMFRHARLDSLEEIIPDHIKDQFIKEKIDVIELITKSDSFGYITLLDNYIELFSDLECSYIDTKVYNILMISEKNETIKSALKSFRFGKDNAVKKIKYRLNDTLTGRLLVREGFPMILNLPKRCRSIFASKWKSEGKLLMVDFSSLEPRIAKKLTSKENYVDIYEEINSLTEDNLDRSVIKRAVISTLYGSNTSLDNISKEKTELLSKVCKEFFKYDSLLDISNENKSLDYRRNFFGRPIWNANEHREHIVINNYIQSTAVDVALMYFYELVKSVKSDLCRPLFIIHDAIVFDVHNDESERFVNYVKQGYNCKKLGYFPLECTDFMETIK